MKLSLRIAYIWIKEPDKKPKIFNFGANGNILCREVQDGVYHIETECKGESSYNIFAEDHVNDQEIDVRALIGNNGSGKTNLLHFLADAWDNKISSRMQYIIALINDDMGKYYLIKNVEIDNINEFDSIPDESFPLLILYDNVYAPYHSLDSEVIGDRVRDYTLMNSIKRDHSEINRNLGIRYSFQLRENEAHFFMETYRQLRYYQYAGDELPFQVNELQVSSIPIEYEPVDFLDKSKNIHSWEKDVRNNLSKIALRIKGLNITDEKYLSARFMLGVMFYSIARFVFLNRQDCKNKKELINDFLQKSSKDLFDEEGKVYTTDTCWNMLYRWLCEIRSFGPGMNWEDIIQSFQKIWNYFVEKYGFQFDGHRFRLTREQISEFLDLWEDYTISTFHLGHYFQFAWGMSSGEYTLFTQFSRMYSLSSEINEKENCIFLIDEADITLHPEWQRKYCNWLIDFIRRTFSKCNLQVIIASHSPIFLSDIPRENIIRLDNDGNQVEVKEKTFAANIYNLYKNNYIFNDGYFGCTIGDFAESKLLQIDEVLDILTEYVSLHRKTCYKLRQMNGSIDDPSVIKVITVYKEGLFFTTNRLSALEVQFAESVIDSVRRWKEKTTPEEFLNLLNDVKKGFRHTMKSRIYEYDYIIDAIGENIISDMMRRRLKSVWNWMNDFDEVI